MFFSNNKYGLEVMLLIEIQKKSSILHYCVFTSGKKRTKKGSKKRTKKGSGKTYDFP